MQKLFVMLGIAAVTVGAASAFGASLISIGVLDEAPPDSGSPESAVLAITPGGEYAVGYSNAANLADTSTIQQPIIWSVGDGLVQLPNNDDISAQATGVVIQPNIAKVGIAGNVGQVGTPVMKYYQAPMTNLTSGTWILNGSNHPIDTVTGPYNSARMGNYDYIPGTYDDVFFIGGDDTWLTKDFVQCVGGAANLDHVNTGYGDCTSLSVCSYKWTPGFDHGNPSSAHRALFMNSNNGSVQTVIPGGSGVASEAYGIDKNATVLCGYDTDTGGATTQAFVWTPGDAAMTLLGTLGSDGDSIGITCNRDGDNYIVAGSSTGTIEQAVIWDTTGTWDSTGQAKLLTALLTTAGVDCSDWSSLTRATTMSDNGMVIAGYGVWAADSSTRGFIAALSSAPSVSTAVSCKEHDLDGIPGTGPVYCINVLDRTNDDDFEGRRYGVTTLVVGFDSNIQGVGGLDVTDVALSPAGSVDNVSLSASDELTIEMSSTTDGVALIVTFPGIASASDASAICPDSVCIRQLVGNVRTDESINAADRIDVRNQMGLDVTASNFRADVRADGSINAADRIDVRNVMGNGYSGYLFQTCP